MNIEGTFETRFATETLALTATAIAVRKLSSC